jgi:hypothetical protein
MLDLLTRTRQRLGDPPRRVDPDLVRPAPLWAMLGREDPYQVGRRLFRDGHLVRAMTVRASSSLFEPGTAEGFAIVVHPAPGTAVSFEQLAVVAGEVGSLASRSPEDPEQAAVTGTLNGDGLFSKVPVPVAIAAGAPLFLSTVSVRPRDLPGRRMRSWFLPVLVHDAVPAVIVLPGGLWAPDLVTAWADLGAEHLDDPPP